MKVEGGSEDAGENGCLYLVITIGCQLFNSLLCAMDYPKADAERLLDISQTTFYKWSKNLGIKLISKINERGKSVYITEEDLQKMAKALGKDQLLFGKNQSQNDKSTEAEESESRQSEPHQEILQQNYDLQIKIKEKEAELKTSQWAIKVIQEQNQELRGQRDDVQHRHSELNEKYVKISIRATAF